MHTPCEGERFDTVGVVIEGIDRNAAFLSDMFIPAPVVGVFKLSAAHWGFPLLTAKT